ncbi:hypothetical protein NA57DRAFT_69170 [Rhizodiscina lignyota]|uniref:GID complex catalytic subunit 2 n=1 Tax=Rhizodiscina lignyota TaxID=1504668 RepID=A0A9P4I6M7_9PEZI|nr:hypothetical protein NA57DRAFT_69170 [Rhizodiscina lignyota]
MDELLAEQRRLEKDGSFKTAIKDVDKTLELLQAARDAIAADPSSAAITLAKLQTPVQQAFEGINNDLKKINKAQKSYDKAFSKKFDQKKAVPMPPNDPLAPHTSLINRAIAMHLLREGQFGVASTFIEEANAHPPSISSTRSFDLHQQQAWEQDFADGTLKSEVLQRQFSDMYYILHELRTNENLQPAIEWARKNAATLESRGSNLEFELCRLQFVVLFSGGTSGPPDADMDMDTDDDPSATQKTPPNPLDGPLRAWAYARSSFPAFQIRYQKEIQQLACGMSFYPNLTDSPYVSLFANGSAWEDVATSFTREFCSLLGLSADSPLYVAATAGAIALPKMKKYYEMKAKHKTEWSTVVEMPVEVPLPPSYYFHPIFVCPVSREQATDANPPMMMPCGHVILQESLANTSKGARFKCPYCPSESHPRDARKVFLA